MRIVAGRFKRRKLLSPPSNQTRPITDRVKEMLFARIEAELQGARVADVFAGTGTIGLEALSRGARSVVFIEKDRKTYQLLRQNVASLGVQQESVCWCVDVFRCSLRPQGCEQMLPYDVIFVDPPFALVEQIRPGGQLFRPLWKLSKAELSSPSALLVLRVPAKSRFQVPEVWQPENQILLKNMEIHLFRKAEPTTTR